MSTTSSFFDFLKPKAGGTTGGNLLRDLASSLTGGLLGSGSMIKTQQQIDAKTMTDQEFFQKYGVARSTVQQPNIFGSIGSIFENVPKLSGDGSTGGTVIRDVIDREVSRTAAVAGESATKSALQKYWWALVLPFGTIIFLLIWVVKSTSKKRKN